MVKTRVDRVLFSVYNTAVVAEADEKCERWFYTFLSAKH